MAASGCLSGVTRSRSSASGVQETPESPGYDSTTRETRSVRQGHRKGIKTGLCQSSAEYLPALSAGPPYGLTIRCRSHSECRWTARKYVFKKAKEHKERNLIYRNNPFSHICFSFFFSLTVATNSVATNSDHMIRRNTAVSN